MPQVYDTCFLFGAGPFFGLPVPPQPGDLILAADGGYRYCQAAGLRPDLLLGDLDSLETPPQALPVQTFPAEKDDTDTMLAVKEAIRRGYQEILMVGIPCWP